MSNYNAQSNNGYADSNANYFANIRPDLYATNRKPSTNAYAARLSPRGFLTCPSATADCWR
ncbi:MAG: hypothetical protein U0Y68_19530 [Blastocatellia bacterium]